MTPLTGISKIAPSLQASPSSSAALLTSAERFRITRFFSFYIRLHPHIRLHLLDCFIDHVDVVDDDGHGDVARGHALLLMLLLLVLRVSQGEMQMTVTFLTIEKDHNAEALFWLETTALFRGPYTEPPPARKNHAEREWKRARIAAGPGTGGGAVATGGQSRENAFVDAARAFISEKKTFLYAEYRDDPVIAATAEAEIRGADQSEKLSRDTVEFKAKQLIMRTLQMLRKEGSVYLKDEPMDLYAILSLEGDIEPACLAAIQSGGKGSAVHYKDIVSIVRRDPKTSFVEVTAIDAALQGLEESSRIYQSGNFEYKIFES